MSARAVTLVLWSALAVIAPTDVVRLRVPAVERVYERLLGFLMRESERVRTPSLILILILWLIFCGIAIADGHERHAVVHPRR
jgi:diacylglycerol kinase (CTP)